MEHVDKYLAKQKAGDSLYGDLLPSAVKELCLVMEKQNHSGMSFGITWQMFAEICLKYYHPKFTIISVEETK